MECPFFQVFLVCFCFGFFSCRKLRIEKNLSACKGVRTVRETTISVALMRGLSQCEGSVLWYIYPGDILLSGTLSTVRTGLVPSWQSPQPWVLRLPSSLSLIDYTYLAFKVCKGLSQEIEKRQAGNHQWCTFLNKLPSMMSLHNPI